MIDSALLVGDVSIWGVGGGRAIANFVIAARFPLIPGEKRLYARLVSPERRQILV